MSETSDGPTVGSTSTLYEQIVEDYLGRLEADGGISETVVENLKKVLATGSPKAEQLRAAFVNDEDIE